MLAMALAVSSPAGADEAPSVPGQARALDVTVPRKLDAYGAIIRHVAGDGNATGQFWLRPKAEAAEITFGYDRAEALKPGTVPFSHLSFAAIAGNKIGAGQLSTMTVTITNPPSVAGEYPIPLTVQWKGLADPVRIPLWLRVLPAPTITVGSPAADGSLPITISSPALPLTGIAVAATKEAKSEEDSSATIQPEQVVVEPAGDGPATVESGQAVTLNLRLVGAKPGRYRIPLRLRARELQQPIDFWATVVKPAIQVAVPAEGYAVAYTRFLPWAAANWGRMSGGGRCDGAVVTVTANPSSAKATLGYQVSTLQDSSLQRTLLPGQIDLLNSQCEPVEAIALTGGGTQEFIIRVADAPRAGSYTGTITFGDGPTKQTAKLSVTVRVTWFWALLCGLVGLFGQLFLKAAASRKEQQGAWEDLADLEDLVFAHKRPHLLPAYLCGWVRERLTEKRQVPVTPVLQLLEQAVLKRSNRRWMRSFDKLYREDPAVAKLFWQQVGRQLDTMLAPPAPPQGGTGATGTAGQQQPQSPVTLTVAGVHSAILQPLVTEYFTGVTIAQPPAVQAAVLDTTGPAGGVEPIRFRWWARFWARGIRVSEWVAVAFSLAASLGAVLTAHSANPEFGARITDYGTMLMIGFGGKSLNDILQQILGKEGPQASGKAGPA